MSYQHTYQLNLQSLKQEALYGVCCLIQNPTEQVIKLREWLAEQRLTQQEYIQQQLRPQDPHYLVNAALNGRKISKIDLNIKSETNQLINSLYEIYSNGKSQHNDDIIQLYNIIMKILIGQSNINQLLQYLIQQNQVENLLLNFFIIYLFFQQEKAIGGQFVQNYVQYCQQILQLLANSMTQSIQLIRLLYLSLYLPYQNQNGVISQILSKQVQITTKNEFKQVMQWFDVANKSYSNTYNKQLLKQYLTQLVHIQIQNNNDSLIQLILQYSKDITFENEFANIIQLKIQKLFSQDQTDTFHVEIADTEQNNLVLLYTDLVELKREIEEKVVDETLLNSVLTRCNYLNVTSNVICMLLKQNCTICQIQVENEVQNEQFTFNKSNVNLSYLNNTGVGGTSNPNSDQRSTGLMMSAAPTTTQNQVTSTTNNLTTNPTSNNNKQQLMMLNLLNQANLHHYEQNFNTNKQLIKLAQLQLLQQFCQ